MQAEKMMELGAKLKESRLAQGFEREVIAAKIKISPKTLYALEEALVDSLPQPIFAKGFARSYAQALGISMDEITPLINEAFPTGTLDNINPELSASAREQSITINQTSNAKVMMVVVPLLILLLGGIGFAAYKYFGADIKEVVSRPAVTSQNGNAAIGNGTGQTRPVTPPAPSRNVESPAPAQPAAPAATQPPAAPAPAPVAETAPPAPEPAPAPAQAPAQAADFPSSLVAQSNTRPDSPIPSGSHRVVLFAKYECWIGAEFDEVGRRSFVLEPGQTFALDFKTRLRLTLGNAGGIDMSFNGEPYNVDGRFREAKVLYFPPQAQPQAAQ